MRVRSGIEVKYDVRDQQRFASLLTPYIRSVARAVSDRRASAGPGPAAPASLAHSHGSGLSRLSASLSSLARARCVTGRVADGLSPSFPLLLSQVSSLTTQSPISVPPPARSLISSPSLSCSEDERVYARPRTHTLLPTPFNTSSRRRRASPKLPPPRPSPRTGPWHRASWPWHARERPPVPLARWRPCRPTP